MRNLPWAIIQVLRPFEWVFSERVGEWAKVLLVGTILAPGQRTVTAALRVMGLSCERQFQNYHRVLNRATWLSRAVSRILLRLLVDAFVPAHAPIVVGLDDHLERRRGHKLAAKGIYRDAVRSSHSFFVKSSGLRWLSMLLLTPIPWAKRLWALPFLTVLAPSARYHQQRGQRHKTLPDWARQMIMQLRRWLPERMLVVVADSLYAVLEVLAGCTRLPGTVTMVTRLRLDAALYDPAPVRLPGTKGAPRKKGARQVPLATRLQDPQTTWERCSVPWYDGTTYLLDLATGTGVWYHAGKPPVAVRWVLVRDPLGQYAPQALVCTSLEVAAKQIVEWFVLRWQLEVTFEEARAHLGVETQRQWSELAVLRTTPALLGLFALVTVFAHQLLQGDPLPVRQAAWYTKSLPTFADTLALVRQQLWPVTISYLSPAKPDIIEIPRPLFDRLMDTLAFAA
ncbi:MAG: transposase [Herpetosiphonaceae bacterium]|nr:transposase [Herpetosiphonaceae bacterium]